MLIKIFVSTVVFVLSATLTESQTFGPTQHQFEWAGQPMYLSSDSSYFQQEEFIMGWHWDA
jgi:hypothetical protein